MPGKTDFLGNLYSFGAMLSFTTAHAAVVALRLRQPDRERPYRVPGSVHFRGRELPVLPIVGGLGTFAAWVSVVILHGEARTVGVAWMVLGVAGYLLYRRHIGVDPRQVTRIDRPSRPEQFEELEYGSALVPIFGTDVDARALSSAAERLQADAGLRTRPALRTRGRALVRGRSTGPSAAVTLAWYVPACRARRPGRR